MMSNVFAPTSNNAGHFPDHLLNWITKKKISGLLAQDLSFSFSCLSLILCEYLFCNPEDEKMKEAVRFEITSTSMLCSH